MCDDKHLLEQYAREGSESAFAELVARHVDLVYSAALRVTNGDFHLAQDVTQMVFIDLARKCRSLHRDVLLAGWLYRHTSYTASKTVRTERRRKTREQIAMEMRSISDTTDPPWEMIAPHLEESLSQLSTSDRDAIVLRFLKRQDFRTVGAAFGISEDAAQKRVSRAIEKLRGALNRFGVALSATALVSALTAKAVTIAPTGLAASITAASLAAAAGTGTTLTILKFMAVFNLKTATLGVIVVLSLGVPLMFYRQAQAQIHARNEALGQETDELAKLRDQSQQLSSLLAQAQSRQDPNNLQLGELLRLRGEIGRLRADMRELAQPKKAAPTTRNEALQSMSKLYSDRMEQLKKFLETNPSENIPELQLLNDSDWLGLARYKIDETQDGFRQAMSRARGEAETSFANSILQPAVKRYAQESNGQFPTDLSQLKSYFKVPVNDAILQRWEIVPGKNLELLVDESWVITQKAPVNKALDNRVSCGLLNVQGFAGPNQWEMFH